jgi:hypothetical protein
VKLTRGSQLRVLVPGAAVLVAIAIATALLVVRGGGSTASTRNQRWRQDVAYLASELPRVHVGGLLAVPRPTWEAAANRLEAEVPRLTNGQVIVGMARMVAMLHDDETLVLLPRTAFFPFNLAWVGGQLCLLIVPKSRRDLLGAQILAVDGHPIGKVLAAIGSVIDGQDAALLRDEEASYLANNAPLLYWLGLTGSPDRATFTVRTVGGLTTAIRLTAVTHASARAFAGVPAPLYRRDQDKPYWLEVLTAQRAVYLKYNACVDDDGFQRLSAEAIALLREHPSYRLIVDLRDNGGGDTQPFTPLVDGLTGDPALSRPDRIFGLINSYTDSSATLDADSLSQIPNAVLIGQPPADPIDEYGNENTLRLPHSGIVVIYTTKIVNESRRKLATPDLTVAPTIAQVLAGADPVLAAALSYGP